MSGFRLSPEGELDDIWLHVARESRSIDIATRLVKRIAEHFWLLADYPYVGRDRDDDLRNGLRSFAADDYLIIHRIVKDDVVPILLVVDASRDIVALFGRTV